MMQSSILCFLLVIPACLALPHYQARIPNGDKVPHPCKGNQNWPGVGHEQQFGGGARNVFGKAFEQHNLKWTKDLCKEDSDGDGKTNGEELGDPECVWTEGQIPSRTIDITHPGICEPFNDTKCQGKNSFVSCELNSFEKCKVIKEKGIQTMNLTLNKYLVPARQTTYVCMTFDLPNDKEYHIVANEAIIDKANVLHHMLLYGCKDTSLPDVAPTECTMFESSCQSIIGVWSVGLMGECFGDSVGFRIGSQSYKRVRLQMHYNNVEKKSSYVDSSGLRLYYRPAKPSVQDMFTLTTGQIMLNLPPCQSRIEEVGVCKSSCTSRALQNTIYIFSALNHMHYFGRSMIIQLVRGGKVIVNLTYDEKFSYDSPVTHY